MLASVLRQAAPLREVERLLPALGRQFGARSEPNVASKPPLIKEFELYRFNPEQDEKPYYKKYRVDINKYAGLR